MSAKLDLCWANHFIDKYEEEFRVKIPKNEISAVLTDLMYERGFTCSKEEYKIIVEEIIYERYM